MGQYVIREEGKNGSVQILEDRIIRTQKKRLGKDDVQTIPIKAVTAVSYDRKTLGTNGVKLTVGSVNYEWKVKNAEEMVDELNAKIYGTT